MLQRIKKAFAILIIIVLLPYIITIFINGKKVESTKETDGMNVLLRDHCISVLAKEVSEDYEEEMLKVQAILVRTTVYKEVEEKGEEIANQEKFGYVGDIEKSWYQKLKTIWEATEGEVIMYGEKLALVPFHQVSNGKTKFTNSSIVSTFAASLCHVLSFSKFVSAKIFSFIPPTGSTLPRNVISPVIAKFGLTFR